MKSVFIKDKWFRLFISEDELVKGINRIALQINNDLKDKVPLFIGVLNGAFMFATELVRRFNYDCEITFIRLKSYEGMDRGSKIQEIQGLTENIENRHVVIIEDIIESGHTIQYLLHLLNGEKPLSVKIATLLLKSKALQFDIQPTYVVKEISNGFVVGFGLDYNGFGRNYRNMYQVSSENK